MTRFLLFIFLATSAMQACSQKPATTPAPATTTTKTTTGSTTTAPAPATNTSGYVSDKEGWLVDLDEAYARSVKENKPILANFTGSDWCGWCKRLDADVFTKQEFKDWAKQNVILLELDFPRRKQIPQKNQQQNYAMQQALQVTGYPTIWLLNMSKDPATGKYNIDPKGKTGYTQTPQQFITTVQGFIRQS